MSTNLKKIRCTLEFNGKTFMISVAPYKRIAYLRQQAQNFFYPITSDIKLVYQNKDITNLQGNLIGDIFRNKEAIYINIKYIMVEMLFAFSAIRTYILFALSTEIFNHTFLA